MTTEVVYSHILVKEFTVTIKNIHGDITLHRASVWAPEWWSQRAVNVFTANYLKPHENNIVAVLAEVTDTIFDNDPHEMEKHFPGVRQRVFEHQVHQRGLFNSPVYFNFRKDSKRLQANACYVLGRYDNMLDILAKTTMEAEIFHGGSGAGSNFSNIREEGAPIAGGGMASGPISYMEPCDAWAKSIKSGGRTRRAARLVSLNDDHPDIEQFIGFKAEEEEKACALMDADPDRWDGPWNANPAYQTVGGQTANYSMAAHDAFMRKACGDDEDPLWDLTSRAPETNGEVIKRLSARDLLMNTARYAWRTGCPGLQFLDAINRANMVALTHMIMGSNPCFAGDTLVKTVDGISTFKDLDGKTSTIRHGNDTYAKAKFFKSGHKDLVRVQFAGGDYVECTPDHKWWVDDEWVEAKDLGGRSLWFQRAVNFTNGRWENPKAVIAGFLFGDGVFHHTNTCDTMDVKFSSKDNDVREYIEKHMSNRPTTKHFSSVEMLALYREFGLDECVNSMRTLSTGKVTESDSAIRSFLKGLFSANGSVVGKKHPRVTLKSINVTVISFVQRLFSSMGIRTYITTNKSRKQKFSNGVYQMRESFDLNLAGRSAQQFLNHIGFIQSYKMEKLKRYLSDNTHRKFIDKRVRVEFVTPIGKQDVYDFTIIDGNGRHYGLINGFKVHNCGEFMGVEDSACNLAALNLVKFLRENGYFDHVAMGEAGQDFIVAMNILASIGWYPSEEMKKNSHLFRPLGLGYGNLGGLLMMKGLPYDSDNGRKLAADITRELTKAAWERSFEISKALGPIFSLDKYGDDMMRIVASQCGMTDDEFADWWGNNEWEMPYNTQVTLLAPLGTTGFVMDLFTTGIEPLLALVQYKTTSSGELMTIISDFVVDILSMVGVNRESAQEHIAAGGSIKDILPDNVDPKVFQTALSSDEEFLLSPMGHIRMQAAVQPYLSSAISKTINLPEDTTPEEIFDIYIEAWRMGLKGITVFRDNCKAHQPVAVTKDKDDMAEVPAEVENVVHIPKRIAPQDDVLAFRHKFSVGVVGGYMHVGFYQDGSICEVFVQIKNHGSTTNGLLNAFSKQVSLSIQYGVPLEGIVDFHRGTMFEPRGMTANKDPEMAFASSIIDYVMRVLEDLSRHPGRHLNRLLELHMANIIEDDEDDEEEDLPVLDAPTEERPSGDGALERMEQVECDSCGSVMVRQPGMRCLYCQSCGKSSGCS